jgi:hypothetical protein
MFALGQDVPVDVQSGMTCYTTGAGEMSIHDHRSLMCDDSHDCDASEEGSRLS